MWAAVNRMIVFRSAAYARQLVRFRGPHVPDSMED